MKSQVEIFVNRMKSNSSRGRSNANDSAVQTLFLNITSMHSKLLAYIKEMDDKRMWFEQLQDKLTQVKDSRAALDMLRQEHQEKLRRIAEETERQRQMQMAHTLELMRKKKQEYLLYQRQLALRQIQEQEREMQMRQEQQKALYQMGGGNFAYMPGMGQSQGSPIHQIMGGANYGYVPNMGTNPIATGVQGSRIQSGQPGAVPNMHPHSQSMSMPPMQAGPISHGSIPPQLGSLPPGHMPQGAMPHGQGNSRFPNTGPHQPNNSFSTNPQQSQGPVGLPMHSQPSQIQGGLNMSDSMSSQQGQFPGAIQSNVPTSQISGIPTNNNPNPMVPPQNMQQPLNQAMPGTNPMNSHMQHMLQQQQGQPMQQQQGQPIQQQGQPMQQQGQPIQQGQAAPQAQQQQQPPQSFAPQQPVQSNPATSSNQSINNAEPSKPAEAELISFD